MREMPSHLVSLRLGHMRSADFLLKLVVTTHRTMSQGVGCEERRYGGGKLAVYGLVEPVLC